MFVFFAGILALFFYKSVSDRVIEYSRNRAMRVKHKFIEAKDLSKTNLSAREREVYECIFSKQKP